MLRRRALGSVAVAALVLVLAVLGATAGGNWEIEHRFDLFPNLRPVPTTTIPEEGPASGGTDPDLREVDLTWIAVIGNSILVALALLAIYRVWKVWRGRIRKHRFASKFEPALLAEDSPEAPPLERGVQAARERLAEAIDPDDAIIAAWLELEHAARLSGVERRRAQTPTEFTVSVLAATEADPEAAQGLLGLYERARFSAHVSEPSDVQEALRFLDRLASGWATSVGRADGK